MSTGIRDVERTNILQRSNKFDIHYIPPELWASIFEEVVLSDDTTCAPMLLLHICHFWREIALTTPQLWTKLDVNGDSDPQQVDFFLQNSMPLRIDIMVDLVKSYDHPPLIVFHAHLHRIRSLDICSNFVTYAQHALSLIGQNQAAPALQILSVTITQEPTTLTPGSEAGFITLKSPFSAVPVIATLTLPLCHLPRNTDILLCSPSLKHLIINSPSYFFPALNWNWVYSAVRAVQNLQSLTFKGPPAIMRPSLSTMLVQGTYVCEAPYLTSIDITAPEWGIKIMRDIIAPLLKKVRIDALGQREQFAPITPTGFQLGSTWSTESESVAKALLHLSRTSPSITHIEMRGIDLPGSGQFTACSLLGGAFPVLEYLTLDDVNVDDSAFAESSSSMPNLKYLELVACPNISGSALLSFVANRRGKLQQLVLRRCSGIKHSYYLKSLSEITALRVLTE
ncbi:hypothetical protein CPC08DRAFT_715877 [Agrocybe pediades]|nr:hypothetical protein CPC08DRAFT_715877 [Agrocybe pediades]